MNNIMPCITDSDDWRFDAADTLAAARAVRVESEADWMLSECKSLDYCKRINSDYDLYGGDLLPLLMAEIASWTGRSDDANERMKNLHNLLADELQKIAESEVE